MTNILTERTIKSIARSIGNLIKDANCRIPRGHVLNAIGTGLGYADWNALHASLHPTLPYLVVNTNIAEPQIQVAWKSDDLTDADVILLTPTQYTDGFYFELPDAALNTCSALDVHLFRTCEEAMAFSEAINAIDDDSYDGRSFAIGNMGLATLAWYGGDPGDLQVIDHRVGERTRQGIIVP